MSKQFSWYDVIDMTAVATKYPEDWYKRGKYRHKEWYMPAFDLLGRFSSEEKALNCLKKWADKKGINFDEHFSKSMDVGFYYADDYYETECTNISECGLYYNFDDNPVDVNDWQHRFYGTSAMIVKKTMTLDED